MRCRRWRWQMLQKKCEHRTSGKRFFPHALFLFCLCVLMYLSPFCTCTVCQSKIGRPCEGCNTGEPEIQEHLCSHRLWPNINFKANNVKVKGLQTSLVSNSKMLQKCACRCTKGPGQPDETSCRSCSELIATSGTRLRKSVKRVFLLMDA